jgi:hypothetical protein
MVFDIEQKQAELSEQIKDFGYRLYHTGKSLKKRAVGMRLVILGAWFREVFFHSVPLQEYRKHYISANKNFWDPEVMEYLVKRYGTVENPNIRRGGRNWCTS